MRNSIAVFGFLIIFAGRNSLAAAIESNVEFIFIKKGDTLSQISEKYLGTLERAHEIVELNQLKNSNKIYVGQKIRLPSKGHAAPVQLKMGDQELRLSFEKAKPPAKPAIESADLLIEEGKKALAQDRLIVAESHFKQARKSDSKNISGWVHEIKVKLQLNKKDEARGLALEFAREFPHLKSLLIIEKALQEASP